MATRKPNRLPMDPERAFDKGVEVLVRSYRFGAVHQTQPTDLNRPPSLEAVFAKLLSLIRSGAVEQAKELFFEDANKRQWRMALRAKRNAHAGAKAVAQMGGALRGPNFNPRPYDGKTVTATQQQRAKRFRELMAQRPDEARALTIMAREDGVTENAIRQSLKAAGITVSTASRRGKRRG